MKRLLLSAALVGVLVTPSIAQQPGVNSSIVPMFAIPIDNKAPTFGSGIRGLVAAASATDIYKICGSASRVVRVSRISISGRATAAASIDVSLVLRSTAGSGGTSTSPLIQPYDSQYPTATAVLSAYTANPTIGTPVGGAGAALATSQLFLGDLTTGAPGAPLVYTFGDRPSSQVVLRGAANCLAINLNGQTASGNLMEIAVEWTENPT